MPSDLTILRVLRHQAPAPVSLHQLAELCGLPSDCVSVRMRSLVTLGYVECVPGAQGDAYTLGPAIVTWPPGAAWEPLAEPADVPRPPRALSSAS